MSWLSKHLGVRFDSHTLGNVLKNVSPALAFTPLGVAGTIGASVLGDAARGKKDIGGVLRSAVTNATLGSGAHALAGKAGFLKSAITPNAVTSAGSATAAPVATTAAPDFAAIDSGVGTLGETAAAAPVTASPINAAVNSAAPSPGGIGGFLRNQFKPGGFIHDNPTAVGMSLQGLGGLATSGAENRMNDAQTRLLNQRYADNESERKRRADLEAYLTSLAPAPLQLAGA